jgi:SAM-dependent methyltransferase
MFSTKKIRNILQAIPLIAKANTSLIKTPRIRNIEVLYDKYCAENIGLKDAVSLDIGCGTSPRNPFGASMRWGLDIRENLANHVKSVDLNIHPIPFDENTFDYITAYDFIEHVPRVIYAPDCRFPFVELMNEIWRTLKYQGIFFSHTPMYPFRTAFGDPTHVNFVTEETFQYFNDQSTLAEMYGFNGAFKVLEQYRTDSHLISVLQKTQV